MQGRSREEHRAVSDTRPAVGWARPIIRVILSAIESIAEFRGRRMPTASNLTAALPPSQEWRELLEEILPGQGAWSDEQYLVLTEHTNRLVEFTDGYLEPLPMPTDRHQAILEFLFPAFLQVIKPSG